MQQTWSSRRWSRLVLGSVVAGAMLGACERAKPPAEAPVVGDEPSPSFRNVSGGTRYVGDSACATCHRAETDAYRSNSMAQSFHRFTVATRIEPALAQPIVHAKTGYSYTVVDSAKQVYQVEYLTGPNGTRLHELRRRMDYVMGSGRVARTYFTEQNGRLYQLPLTWYRDHGWDMSPGYVADNPRFDRLMPDQCLACHSSYPTPIAHLEGKYATLNNGIGCERCHGPGALHVSERTAKVAKTTAYDATIVNPAHLPLERRLDVCEQCHVHTAVSVVRDGKTPFSYLPSQPLRDQIAFFKDAGSIDLVSHADRLRQSACFLKTRQSAKPLECSTCHDPHRPSAPTAQRNAPCATCHATAALAQQLAASPSRAQHGAGADCVQCHMPKVRDRAVHGAFTDHWVRVVRDGAKTPVAPRTTDGPIEPYYARDRTGPEAARYLGMGGVVHALMTKNGRAMSRAADQLRKTLGNDTSHPSASFLLGIAYQQVGETAAATRALENAVRADSTRPDALRALAQASVLAGNTTDTVTALYVKALALQPALAWVRAEYADVLAARGQLDEAERAYRTALAEEPTRAGTWFNLGTLLAAQGKMPQATAAFREAVHLDPSLAQALSPLVFVGTSGSTITRVTNLGSPLDTMPVRDRGPSAFGITVADAQHVAFLHVPAKSFVLIFRPDGTLLCALPTGDGGSLRWDLHTAPNTPIGAGLYRAQLEARDAEGRPAGSQAIPFGIVRSTGQ